MSGGVGGTAVRNPREQFTTGVYRGPTINPDGGPGYGGMGSNQQTAQGQQQMAGTMEYLGRNNPGGTPGYGGQGQTPWQQTYSGPSGYYGAPYEGQPGAQYYNPYYGQVFSNQGPVTLPGVGGSQYQTRAAPQPQINLGAMLQRMSNPQSKSPQGPGPDVQMNQSLQRRRLRPVPPSGDQYSNLGVDPMANQGVFNPLDRAA